MTSPDEAPSLASRLGWDSLIHYFDFGGRQIAYALSQAEPGSKGTLLLLHGFPTSSWDWYKVWPILARDYQLIAPDFLGFGLSDKPVDHDYTLMEQADLCDALLAHLRVSQVHLIAHDYGDSVVQELLARHSALTFDIGKAVLLNGGILAGFHRPRPIQSLLAGPLGSMLRHLLTKQRFKTSLSAVFGPDTQPVDAELNMMWDYITHNDGHRIAHRLLAYMEERKTHAARWRGAVLMPPVPLLLINGPEDPVSGRHVMEAYREQEGAGEIISLDGIGHYPQVEAPNAVAEAILAFLETS